MRLSIAVPAHNEARLLGGCLDSVRQAVRTLGLPDADWELVVCDNASTDGTAELARRAGARVVFEPVRRISRARNAAGANARGEWLLFIDADSRLSAGNLAAVLRAAAGGRCVGGGCVIAFDRAPWWGAALTSLWNALSRAASWAAGSFVFCRADAFREVGGFPPELAAGEELGLSRALKAWGRRRGLGFVVLSASPHVSSGRKFYLYRPGEFAAVLWKTTKSLGRSLRDPEANPLLYDGRR
ncbi:MAG: glycosyltransferase [Elusimicrobia bacterium]|nr:glycosyltransferase [Elusimicrobiota bacterium]